MQEFVYYNASWLDFPISEEIFVTTNIEETKNKNFLISNSKEINCELVAPEIDFYIKNSQDTLANKIKNVSKLYDIASTKYDFAQDIFYSQEISKDVLLITNSKEEYDAFILKINSDDFELYTINETILKKIEGHIGNLKVGTLLVFFSEIGLAQFTKHPINELFNLSVELDHLFDKSSIDEVQDNLASAQTDTHRIKIVEQFLLAQLVSIKTDKLIVEAVQMIYRSKGSIRVKELNQLLNISASPFEKRFRKIVGVSPKKFASIVRFNVVLNELGEKKSLAEICYENNFFDQAHFIKDFKQFTGETPDKMRPLEGL